MLGVYLLVMMHAGCLFISDDACWVFIAWTQMISKPRTDVRVEYYK